MKRAKKRMDSDLLDLGSNRLQSTLPEGIYQLSHLNDLNLNDCLLGGSITEGIGNLKSMRKFSTDQSVVSVRGLPNATSATYLSWVLFIDRLDLHNNAFTGSIPDQIGALKTVREYDDP